MKADMAPVKKSVEELVLECLCQKRDTAGSITTWARSNGAPGISISDVDRVLSGLARAGRIRLKAKWGPAKNQQDQPDRWEVNPMATGAARANG
jgi:hypothetical protein